VKNRKTIKDNTIKIDKLELEDKRNKIEIEQMRKEIRALKDKFRKFEIEIVIIGDIDQGNKDIGEQIKEKLGIR
jgi:hypothetical protein